MRILKANTAVRLVVGPLCDKTTGLAKPSMTVTNMAMNMWHEHDDGSAPTKSIDAVAFTASGGSNDMVELAGGYYDIEITAAQLNITAGRASFCIYDDDVILPYFEEWLVVPANVFDSIMGTDTLDVMVTGLADDVITAAKFDESTAFPVKSADTGATQIARVGADSDTLETLSDQMDAVKTETASILEDTGTTLDTLVKDIPTNAELATALGTADDAVLAAVAAAKTAIDDIQNTEIAAILADTNELQTDLVNGGRLDLLIDGIKAKTDNIPAAADVADAVWGVDFSNYNGADEAGGELDTAIANIASILEDTGTTLPALITPIGIGAGATAKTYTITDSGTGLPIADVDVWASTDSAGANIVASDKTNSSGQVTFYLDSGTTYYIWRQKDGYNFTNPDVEVA